MSAKVVTGGSKVISSSTSAKRSTKRRPQTPKRKEQNRVAQRTYREKQARILQELKRRAGVSFDARLTESVLQTSTQTPTDARCIEKTYEHDDAECVLTNQQRPVTPEELSALPVDATSEALLEKADIVISQNHLAPSAYDTSHRDSLASFLEADSDSPHFFLPEQNATPCHLSVYESSEALEYIPLSHSYDAKTPDPPLETFETPLSSFDSLAANLGKSTHVPQRPPESSIPKVHFSLKTNDSQISYNESYTHSAQNLSQLEPFRRLLQLDDTEENNQLVRTAVEGNHDMKDILLAGLLSIQGRSSKLHTRSPFVADPYKNNLRLVRVSTVDAYLSNALSLGMSISELYRDKCPSPFYHPEANNTALHLQTFLPTLSDKLPPDLRPTRPQIMCSHHPYLDLLPFPVLRARAIALAARNPPLIDEKELKKDIMNGGLICWHAGEKGTGEPWDMRSWEAASWFLRKWSVLVGGEDGDVWKQTMWWRGFRGEEKSSLTV